MPQTRLDRRNPDFAERDNLIALWCRNNAELLEQRAEAAYEECAVSVSCMGYTRTAQAVAYRIRVWGGRKQVIRQARQELAERKQAPHPGAFMVVGNGPEDEEKRSWIRRVLGIGRTA